MEKSIFQLASEYNFDAVFDYHNNGNSINICDEDGNSLFATFLSGYACYGDIVEDEEELLTCCNITSTVVYSKRKKYVK